jgi:hypothetical protein
MKVLVVEAEDAVLKVLALCSTSWVMRLAWR